MMDSSKKTVNQSILQEWARYERILHDIGIRVEDFPEDVNALLDDCIKLQLALKVSNLDVTSTQSVYCSLKKKKLDNELLAIQLKSEIKNLDHQIKKETEEYAMLQAFAEEAKRNQMTSEEANLEKINTEALMAQLKTRHDALKLPKDSTMERLMEKIKLLESKKQKK